MDEHRKNQAWFYGWPVLALTGPLGISVAAVSHGARSLGASLAGANPPPFSSGEIAVGILIATLPVLGITTIHYVQLRFFGRTEFAPHDLKKDPTSISKAKLRAMCPEVPPELLSKNPDGMTIGKYKGKYVRLNVNDRHNIVSTYVNGSPGSNKTTSLETMLLWNWSFAPPEDQMTFFVSDLKPEIMLTTVVYDPSDPNSTIRCINPASTSPYYYGWDMYHGLDENSTDDQLEERMDMIARSLIQNPSEGGKASENGIFYSIAQDIMVAILLYGFLTGKGFIDSILQLMSVPIDDLIAEVLSSSLCDRHPKLRMYLQPYDGDDSEMIIDAAHTMRENLRIFSQESVRFFFRDNERKCSPSDLLRGNSIFLQIPDNLITQYRAIITLLWQDVLKTLMAVPDYERSSDDPNTKIITLLADEFPSYGYIPIADFMSKCRSRLYSVILVAQSTSQISAIYGQETERTILQDCVNKIIFGSTDERSNLEFSKMAGNYRESMLSNSRNSISHVSSLSEHISDQYRPIYESADFTSLRKDNNVIAFTDDGHYRIEKCPFYMIPELHKRSEEIKKRNIEIMKKEGVL